MGFVALAKPRGCAVGVTSRGLGQQMASTEMTLVASSSTVLALHL